MQNGFIESFNGRLRPSRRWQAIAERATDEFLNETLFTSLGEARQQIHGWRRDDNRHRPHSSLENVPPAEFAMKMRLEMLAE